MVDDLAFYAPLQPSWLTVWHGPVASEDTAQVHIIILAPVDFHEGRFTRTVQGPYKALASANGPIERADVAKHSRTRLAWVAEFSIPIRRLWFVDPAAHPTCKKSIKNTLAP
jgi:hypothetical protein